MPLSTIDLRRIGDFLRRSVEADQCGWERLRYPRRLLATTIAAITIVALVPSSAQASHSWVDYHWARIANPFTVELDDKVTSTWDSYLTTASADWTASSKLDTVVLQGSLGSKRSCTPATGHVEVCNATYGTTGWLGSASISITTGDHISRG
jgi:hypothetical protein